MRDLDPIQWAYRVTEVPKDCEAVTIDRVRNRTGVVYAIRQSGACMDANGNWEFECNPSDRTDEWLARFRFQTFIEAAHAVRTRIKHPAGRFSGYYE